MKIIATLILFLSVTSVYCQALVSKNSLIGKTKTVGHQHPAKKLKSYLIHGLVEQTSSYCGGARPSQEMLDRLATPISYPNKKFYIRQGKINHTEAKIVKSFTTDSTGKFSIRLKPGTYSIIVEEQLYSIDTIKYENENQEVDRQCLEEWWAKPYHLLIVKNKNITDLKFIFHHRCFVKSHIPCITYKGPLPP